MERNSLNCLNEGRDQADRVWGEAMRIPLERMQARDSGKGVLLVSQLYDLKLLVETQIASKGLDPAEIRGKIGLKSGRLLSFISATTPDDAAAVAKLRQAIKDVLNITA